MEQLPKYAKLVFEGKIFKIYQWEQKMFDGSIQIFEIAKRNDNVQVLATVNDKIILIKELQPHFKKYKISLPGGNVDDNESPKDAAKREFFEETGYKADNLVLFKKNSLGSKVIRTFYLYITKNPKQINNVIDTNGEKIQLMLVDFNDFIKLSQNENFRNKELTSYIKQIQNDDFKMLKFKELLFKQQ